MSFWGGLKKNITQILMKILTMYVRLWFINKADLKVNWTDKEVSFPIFYYNYLYIMDLLQLLHGQTC